MSLSLLLQLAVPEHVPELSHYILELTVSALPVGSQQRTGQTDSKGPSSLVSHPQQRALIDTHRREQDKHVMLVFCLPLPPAICS